MALPQRRDPNEEQRMQDLERRRIETERPATAGGFGWWWLWLLIIIAIIWFAGWGWGGYGGWWWGRRALAPVGSNAATNGTNANGVANGNNAAVVPTGDGVAILNAANKATFIGQKVDIRDVRVNNKVNDHAFWIGNSDGNDASVADTNGVGTNAGVAANGATANGQNASSPTANTTEIPTLVVLTGAANANGGGNNAANGGNNTENTAKGSLSNINEGQLVNVIGTVEKAPTAKVAQNQWGLDKGAAQRLQRDGAYIRATQVTTAAGGPQQ